MELVKEKVELLLHQTADMKRGELVTVLKRYRGWELSEIANYLGYRCNIRSSKVVPLQIVLNHLLSCSDNCKVS